MKNIILFSILGLCCVSCKKTGEISTGKNYKNIKTATFSEADFSAWMTKAEQQVQYDTKPADHYFAYVEGRNEGGLNQYRHVMSKFPADRYAEWSVYWGLSTEEFYQVELRMLRGGFVRESLQVFTDTRGMAFHQAVWLKPKGAATIAASPAPKPIPTPQVILRPGRHHRFLR